MRGFGQWSLSVLGSLNYPENDKKVLMLTASLIQGCIVMCRLASKKNSLKYVTTQ